MSRSRLPSWSDIQLRLGLDELHPIRVSTNPEVVFVVDPVRRELGLQGPTARSMPDRHTRPAAGLRVQPQATARASIWVEDPNLLELGWTFLVAVAARVLDGDDTLDALDVELLRWRELVSRLSTAPAELYIGLLGELVTLRSAVEDGHALSSWVGSSGDSVDFRFGSNECEVKTTLGNRHEHIIHGSEQLQPSVGASLALLSIRIGHADGDSGDSVSSVRNGLVAAGLDSGSLDGMLQLRGANLDDELASARFILRSDPLAVDVGPEFPALTSDRLRAVLNAEARRVRDLTYRLDLEGMGPTENSAIERVRAGIRLG